MFYFNKDYKDLSFLPRKLQKAIKWYRKSSFSKLSDEKNYFSKEGFAVKAVIEIKNRKTCLFESHKKVIDVHCIVSGEEIMEIAHPKQLKIHKKYNKEIDAALYQPGRKQTLVMVLKPGDIVVLYPEDAHMPGIRSGQKKFVKKIILKVKV